jgi:hypothetical protein
MCDLMHVLDRARPYLWWLRKRAADEGEAIKSCERHSHEQTTCANSIGQGKVEVGGFALRQDVLSKEILSRLSRLSFLFRGVQRRYFSFQRERSEIMKVDEWLISAKELPWQKMISLCRSQLDE